MLPVNRYKDVALGIVRRWALSGEFLVDRHITVEMLASGFLGTVVGAAGTGKTILGAKIAQRLHKLGCRAPAFIDEGVFHHFIDVPRRLSDEPYSRPDPFCHIRDMAIRTHTPVIVTITSSRGFFRQATPYEDHMNHAFVMGHHSAAMLSDVVWAAFTHDRKFYAKLLKSRTLNVKMIGHMPIIADPDYRIEDCPFYQRGVEMAWQISRNR